MTASYFDSEVNQNKTVTYHTPDIFYLVLAATLDNGAYEEIESDLTEEEQEQNRIARIRTLFDSIFSEGGIEGRCNQGIRHEMVGCLNGVYPKSGKTRWYFIEDIHNAIEAQVRDYLDSRIKINLSIVNVERESDTVTLTLKDYLLFNDYCLNGQFTDGITPKIVSDLQSSISQKLIAWAKDCFLNPSEILTTSSNIKINEIIIGQLIGAMEKVALFKAWEQLQLCAETPDGCSTWLMSIENCKQMITVVTSWLSSQTPGDIDKLIKEISNDFVTRLSTLGELVAMGNELDIFYSLSIDDFETSADSLSKLPIIDSMDAFNNMPLKPFSQTILSVKQTLQNLSLERILWELISAKQQARKISGKLVETFKKVVAVKKIDGLMEADIALMLDFINKPGEQDNQDNSDILIWSANHAHHRIMVYLVRSVLKEKTTAPSTARLLLGQLSVNEALMTAIEYEPELATQVLTILSSYPEIFKIILTQRSQNGHNYLMFAIDQSLPKITNTILDILVSISESNPEVLKTVLTQCNNSGRNCLMYAANEDYPEITNRILDMLIGLSRRDPEVLKTVLTQCNNSGRNCLMYAANNNHPEITNRIIDMLIGLSRRDPEVLKTVLTQCNNSGRNCLMYAANNNHPEITNQILDTLVYVSRHDLAALKIVLTQQIEDCCTSFGGWNCLMLAANKKHSEVTDRILGVLYEASSSDPDIVEAVLSQKSNDGKSCRSMVEDRLEQLNTSTSSRFAMS